MKTRRVLVVEDEHALAVALASVVVRAGAEAVKVASGAAALEQLQGGGFSLVILDIGLPDMSGLDVLQRAFPDAGDLPVPVLVITAHGNLENAIAARKLGAAEYLVKPLDLPAFQEILGRFLKPARPAGVGASARDGDRDDADRRRGRDAAGVSRGGACLRRHDASRDHRLDWAGKSLAARVIHANGARQGETMTAFGDGSPDRSGMLLVEDVDALDAAAQASLLKLLEPGGAPRVIATTRHSLHAAVAAGAFREDLYYRLNVLEIRLPDLADRLGDVPALAQYFLGRAANDRALAFSPEVMAILEGHSWPGNVLELRNAVDYAVGVCGGAQILPQHLPASVVLKRPEDSGELVASLRRWLDGEFAERGDELRYAELIGKLEGSLLKELLWRFDGKPTRVAAALGMNRTTLRKKCAELLEDGTH